MFLRALLLPFCIWSNFWVGWKAWPLWAASVCAYLVIDQAPLPYAYWTPLHCGTAVCLWGIVNARYYVGLQRVFVPLFWSCSCSIIPWGFTYKRKKERKKESEVAQLCTTLCDPMDCIANQASPSMGFSRQEYWSGLLFPSPGDLPDLGIEPRSLALQEDTLLSEPPGKPSNSFRDKIRISRSQKQSIKSNTRTFWTWVLCDCTLEATPQWDTSRWLSACI